MKKLQEGLEILIKLQSTRNMILKYIQAATTKRGLSVSAHLVWKKYDVGTKVTNENMEQLRIVKGVSLPPWNYTLKPKKMAIACW